MRRTALNRDWTKGSIAGNLWSLSWPIIISQSLNQMGPIIDMIWVGRLGAASIAGVGVSGMVVLMVNAMMMGVTMGTRALVARFAGASDARGANHVAQQAFVISAGYAITMAAIGIFFAEPILILFGLEADVVAEGAAYMRIMFVGSAAMAFWTMTEGVMQASGDTVTPMRIAIFFRLFHVALCPFLIFGWWIFPRLGVSGAATTNVISQSLGLALGLWVLFSGRTRLRLTLRNFRLNPNMIWRIVRIGIPASVASAERNLGSLVVMWLIVPFGTLAVAAHTLGQRVESILHTPIMALGAGAGVIAAQNLGAGQPERAERSGWLAIGFAEIIMLVGSVAILLWAESIISIFGPEPDVIELASIFMRIATASYIVLGFVSVLHHCISGTGDTLPSMLITLISMWGVEIPLAFFIPRVTNLGVYGVRWAIVIDTIVRALAFTAYFKVGRWKRKKV